MFAALFDPAGLQIMAVGVDGKFGSYSCEVCAGIPGLLRLAQRRLEATGPRAHPGRAAALSRVHDSVSRA